MLPTQQERLGFSSSSVPSRLSILYSKGTPLSPILTSVSPECSLPNTPRRLVLASAVAVVLHPTSLTSDPLAPKPAADAHLAPPLGLALYRTPLDLSLIKVRTAKQHGKPRLYSVRHWH
jgi:hypothetical protein